MRRGTHDQPRIFFIGGLMSYRALFGWMNPWIFIPSLLVSPVCQILLFAYIGRSAGVGTDEFYVIGNALNYAAIPCMFAMTFTIGGERFGQTLGLVLATPARRIPLFLGRSMPVIANGWFVAMFGVVVGSLLLDVDIPRSAWPLMALVVAVGSLASTGLGLVMGAINLVYRDGATMGNVFFLVLLDLHRHQRRPRRPAGLDGGDRPLPAADPRHRGDPDAGRRCGLGRGVRASSAPSWSSAWPTSPSASARSGCSSG